MNTAPSEIAIKVWAREPVSAAGSPWRHAAHETRRGGPDALGGDEIYDVRIAQKAAAFL